MILIKVKIYLINDSVINATVCKIENTYYISLFSGAITHLKDFVSYFVMSNFLYDFFEKQFGNLYENQGSIFEFFKECDCEYYQLVNNIAEPFNHLHYKLNFYYYF